MFGNREHKFGRAITISINLEINLIMICNLQSLEIAKERRSLSGM